MVKITSRFDRVGDIRNLSDRRKSKLEEDLMSAVYTLMNERQGYNVDFRIREIVVIGSWAEGTAVPSRSDLDLIMYVTGPNGQFLSEDDLWPIEVEFSNSGRRHPLNRVRGDGPWPRFNGYDLWVRGDKNSYNKLLEEVVNERNGAAYNLTERTDIRV